VLKTQEIHQIVEHTKEALSSMKEENVSHNTTFSTLNPTKDGKAVRYKKPPSLKSEKYEKVLQAQEILAYIMTKLNDIDAPVILMYGTMLHEFRNGTDEPFVSLNFQDKDFDIAVFPEHYRSILSFQDEIQAKFGWKIGYTEDMKNRSMAAIYNPEMKKWKYQIDVYGFRCSKTNDLILFPWDNITIARNSFLPVRKHKPPISSNENSTDNKSNPVFYIPHNPPCLLNNIYGSDYMTPKTGRSTQAKWGTKHGRPAHGNPECDSTLTTSEQQDLERQLALFC